MEKILELIAESIENDTLVKIILGNLRKKSVPYKKVTVRPVIIKNETLFQIEYHFEKKVTQENVSKDVLPSIIEDFMTQDFKQLNLLTTSADIQVLANDPQKPRITKKNACREKNSAEHNVTKKYAIPDGEPCDFLRYLGVMDEKNRVVKKHYAKFRQINRFLEIVSDAESFLPKDKTLKIIDFGCGKAYLTFALYYYLVICKKMSVDIVGLDLKEDVIDFCNNVAKELGYDGLSFLKGDIADYTEDRADMVVTLHACDTATDFALINAVSRHTKVILSVPCCQHELFDRIKNDIHAPMYKHGILKDRFTEILTDGLRGLALERNGYDVDMIEFTSLEHTARNIMIRAVLTSDKDCACAPVSKKAKKAESEYRALAEFYNVYSTTDRLLEQGK
ncbi:MAG: SAM-dependent methyltransferase [Clostridia bacterium]|nr:SAM-dependent methyltransferase [Clostridia bacterium]